MGELSAQAIHGAELRRKCGETGEVGARSRVAPGGLGVAAAGMANGGNDGGAAAIDPAERQSGFGLDTARGPAFAWLLSNRLIAPVS
jgi:hypothetical protein